MERQRLAEWEKQRKAELVQHRQREQEKVLELKAKKENLDAEFEKMVKSELVVIIFYSYLIIAIWRSQYLCRNFFVLI